MIIAISAKPDPDDPLPHEEGCRSEQVPSVSDLARSIDICGIGYSVQFMLQLITPPIDQLHAVEPKDPAASHDIYEIEILHNAL